jgi:Uma2 family endonuclease
MTTLSQLPILERPERLFSVDEYMRMIGAGILTKRDKVELIEGRVVKKMAIDPPRVAALERLCELLRRVCGTEWIVRMEAPLKLESSLPEPDAMVIRGPADRYDDQHPSPEDVLLVIEVSNSTLREDRNEMSRLYAGARIPYYWIVNLRNRCLEVHADPTGTDALPTYRRKQDIADDGTAILPFPEGAKDIVVGNIFSKKSAVK